MTQTPPSTQHSRLSRIALNVRDIDRSAKFYEEALGFVRAAPPAQGAADIAALLGSAFQSLRLTLGEDTLELTQLDHPGAPYPLDSRANDLWFQHFAMLTDDMEAAVSRLQAFQPQSITDGGPQILPARSGGATAYKFRDPDGHPLELLRLPGAPRNRSRKTPLYAINHSAISVATAGKSITFYKETLGLSQESQQTNSGPEQDHLDGLKDAVVEVVTLRPTQPEPHLELLSYRQPRGRQLRPPLRATDIAATRLVFSLSRSRTTAPELARNANRAPPGTPLFPGNLIDTKTLLHDPDNHFLLLEPAPSSVPPR